MTNPLSTKDYSFDITYVCGNKKHSFKGTKSQHLNLQVKQNGEQLSVSIDAKESLEIKSFKIVIPFKYEDNYRVFANGYQSWTDSKEYTIHEKMSGFDRIVEMFINSRVGGKTGLNRAGDCTFHKYPRSNGIFYGFSYSYVRDGKNLWIFGSLSEETGYTIVTFDVNKSCVIIEKELEGVTFKGKSKILEMACIADEYDTAFDRYFEMMNIPKPRSKRVSGYTTWYNYYSNITQQIVETDLEELAKLPEKVDIFQIDDGYQAAIGDWLITDTKKFPKGMKSVADEIHKKGMLAGLWLAPFSGVKSSRLFKEHPDYFIKGKNGKPYLSGPNWGGFYALDIYNEGARKYLKQVFHTVLIDWGYDMVKLDFLYAACVLPNHNKPRGKIMCDAMDLIRECVGDKLILGCGTPLMPTFGKVDYCRIGPDMMLSWKPNSHTTREDVSTPIAVNNSAFRRHLDDRAFVNDPDVFLLRDNNMHMTFEKRKRLSFLNSIFGNLLFMSDNVGTYSKEQLDTFIETVQDPQVKIISAEYIRKNIMRVIYEQNGKEITMTFNILNGDLVD